MPLCCMFSHSGTRYFFLFFYFILTNGFRIDLITSAEWAETHKAYEECQTSNHLHFNHLQHILQSDVAAWTPIDCYLPNLLVALLLFLFTFSAQMCVTAHSSAVPSQCAVYLLSWTLRPVGGHSPRIL